LISSSSIKITVAAKMTGDFAVKCGPADVQNFGTAGDIPVIMRQN
jgi:hypothetical protein